MSLTVTDLFCGAGGSSQGMEAVGAELTIAANHWQLAVETHAKNFPNADHDCADISQANPRRYPRTQVLWASPECTNHSQAKGKKRDVGQMAFGEEPLPDEAADRSRATMWDVVRFAEHHRYPAILVENVVDAAKWVLYPAWRQALTDLGYCVHEVCLNSMHAHGKLDAAPQSRDRMYWVCHRTSMRCPDLDIRPRAWCGRCSCEVDSRQAWKPGRPTVGKYRSQYTYVCGTCGHRVEPFALPAASAIDWTMLGQRIGDRDRPLAIKTRARIAAGLAKYARPIHVEAGGNQYDSLDPNHPQHGDPAAYVRAWPADSDVYKTLHTQPTKGIAYAPGMLVPVEGRDGKTALTVLVPMRTATTRNETALVCPPFIAELRGGGSDHRPITVPLGTFSAGGTHHGLVLPPGMVMRNNGSRGDGGEHCTPLDEVLRTLTTMGHQSLVTWASLYAYDTGALRSVLDALPAQTTVEGDAILSGDLPLPDVDECMFRMLEPHEIQAGMAFGRDYHVLGNKREQVRQLGNAVTPPAAALLFERIAPLVGAA